ncbi:hypothetical protein HHK36_010584 [Tetracentron sinense]|uniref:Uncharacterized protein n=1 Tax=Tetracentron sinense TaxID=13715 RepID=A0A835DJP1_TETSI|nr:hypothetical protein HHK36_010584 [Tetracentron sinense]
MFTSEPQILALTSTALPVLGFLGMWFGLVAAQASCVCMMVYTFVRTDQKRQAKRAKELTLAAAGDEGDLEDSLLH